MAAKRGAAVPKPPAAVKPAKTARVTQGDRLFALLERKGGAPMAEITKALGIQPHSARSLISREAGKRRMDVVLKDGRYTAAPFERAP